MIVKLSKMLCGKLKIDDLPRSPGSEIATIVATPVAWASSIIPAHWKRTHQTLCTKEINIKIWFQPQAFQRCFHGKTRSRSERRRNAKNNNKFTGGMKYQMTKFSGKTPKRNIGIMSHKDRIHTAL